MFFDVLCEQLNYWKYYKVRHNGQFIIEKRQIKLECKTDWAFNYKSDWIEFELVVLCPSYFFIIYFFKCYIHLDQEDFFFF